MHDARQDAARGRRDPEHPELPLGEDAALEILQGHSITYRTVIGPQEGRKALTVQTLPALAEGRLSLTRRGRVRYALKTPYRDGTTHVVFAPHSQWRAQLMARYRWPAATPRIDFWQEARRERSLEHAR